MDKQISLEQISKFSEEYNKNRNNKIIENAITKNGLENACIDRQVIIENVPIFNIELPESTRYDQKDSYKCWIYAGINVIKHNIAQNLNIDIMKLELSNNFIAFFDKLEMGTNLTKLYSYHLLSFYTVYFLSNVLYCIASIRCFLSIFSFPSRSAIVRATFKILL